jgi:hypothetical protein
MKLFNHDGQRLVDRYLGVGFSYKFISKEYILCALNDSMACFLV